MSAVHEAMSTERRVRQVTHKLSTQHIKNTIKTHFSAVSARKGISKRTFFKTHKLNLYVNLLSNCDWLVLRHPGREKPLPSHSHGLSFTAVASPPVLSSADPSRECTCTAILTTQLEGLENLANAADESGCTLLPTACTNLRRIPSSLSLMMLMAQPSRPNRPVRPTRC